jgi:NAD(P)-dependent dehydrogenase (short-subunit alcohol dehydrogenase family)
MDMTGKLCIVTGASSGIGRAAARELAHRGAGLALVCRSPERGRETVAEVRRGARPGGEVTLFLADLAVQDEIRRVAGELLARYSRIDVLLNNAGVVNLTRQTTADGIEETFAVNHLGYYLLTRLLLPRLRESAPSRIVNVASDAHHFVRAMNLDDLGFERGYGWTKSYGQSKLANILFTYELARRLAGTGVTVNCLHPGMVATGLGSNHGLLSRLLLPLLRPFSRTPERGAETSIYLASSPAVAGVTGKYFADCKERRSGKHSYDEETGRRLWDVSAALVGLEP